MAESHLALLPAAKRKMLQSLAEHLAGPRNEVQLDAVVCQLPQLETDKLDALRSGLEILFERAGPAMVVDKATFLDAMALGQMPNRGPAPAERRPARRSQEMSYDPSEGSDLAELPAQRSRREDRNEAPADTGRPLVRPAVYASAYGGTARRKSVQALEEEMRAKEMRECSFAPKLTKPPAYLKWSKEKRQPRAVAPPRAASTSQLVPTRGSSPRATRRTQRVREMLEERQAEEMKECTFAPKINPAPKQSVANGLSHRPPVVGVRRSQYKWQDSLRTQGAQPASREDAASARSFFNPPPREFERSRSSSEYSEEEARGLRALSHAMSHQVVLRD